MLHIVHVHNVTVCVVNVLPQNAGQDDCYAARLLVQRTNPGDARDYFFNVENERGADRYAVSLAVRGEAPGHALIGSIAPHFLSSA